MKANYRLYLVTEESVPVEELLFKVEEAVKGGVTLVQLREKLSSGNLFYEKAKRLKKLLAQYHVPLIINDRVDVALAIDADGVHIGQNDIPLSVVKEIVPDSMIVGVSVSTVEEAREAEKNGADYLGVGAMFPTRSKSDAEELPSGMLDSILENVSIPIVAIGGIQLNNLAEIRDKNIAGIAVVSGIMKADDPFIAAKAFRNSFQ
ncbi:thiamine phosphate synthase [Cytobacillus dafuensis]|uniref:Thiamine-phosphate synthase n=1 Tax=Cytobacillus dafuensis TaxID=1742359 RepID=A0A5B8Z6L5_CYTDA|nr:thiamine phosphate synthase [Cytobacillus dafuensis]QED47813.1 thiamine phosphate synthase [Cytobacillus dafuensis]